MAFDLEKEQQYTNPMVIFGDKYATLQSFFQYKFPPRKTSPQSLGIQESLSDKKKDELYKVMLESIEFKESDMIFSSILFLNNNNDLIDIHVAANPA